MNEVLTYIRPHTRTEFCRLLNDQGIRPGETFVPAMPHRCKNYGIWLKKYRHAEFTRRYLAWKAAAEAQG